MLEMKVYTKTGDDGTTSLFSGKRVPKHDLRIKSYGTIDVFLTRQQNQYLSRPSSSPPLFFPSTAVIFSAFPTHFLEFFLRPTFSQRPERHPSTCPHSCPSIYPLPSLLYACKVCGVCDVSVGVFSVDGVYAVCRKCGGVVCRAVCCVVSCGVPRCACHA